MYDIEFDVDVFICELVDYSLFNSVQYNLERYRLFCG